MDYLDVKGEALFTPLSPAIGGSRGKSSREMPRIYITTAYLCVILCLSRQIFLFLVSLHIYSAQKQSRAVRIFWKRALSGVIPIWLCINLYLYSLVSSGWICILVKSIKRWEVEYNTFEHITQFLVNLYPNCHDSTGLTLFAGIRSKI